jgi:hypothetical protein
MRRLFAAIIFLGILSCNDNDVLPTTDNYRLIKILNYPSLASSEPNGKIEFSYDSKGNLIRESTFDHRIILTTYIEYEYSGNEMTTKKIYDGQVGNLHLGTYISYNYIGGKLSKEELFSADGTLKYTTVFEFENEKLINTYKVDDHLGIHHQYKYTFDDQNRLILEEVFMYDQELSGFTKYFYDAGNRLAKTEVYNPNGELIHYVENSYTGTSERANEEFYFNQDGTLTQTRQLVYDSRGNLTEINVVGQGSSCRLFKRAYNGELLTEEIKYASSFGCEVLTVTRYGYEKY